MEKKHLLKRLMNIGYTEDGAKNLYWLYEKAGRLEGLESYVSAKEDIKNLNAALYDWEQI